MYFPSSPATFLHNTEDGNQERHTYTRADSTDVVHVTLRVRISGKWFNHIDSRIRVLCGVGVQLRQKTDLKSCSDPFTSSPRNTILLSVVNVSSSVNLSMVSPDTTPPNDVLLFAKVSTCSHHPISVPEISLRSL